MHYDGLRATVMGLGHFGGGVAAARWLARQGAKVTVTDRADAGTLAAPLAQLQGEPIAKYHLGGHREQDFCECDLLVANPAVRPGDAMVEAARRRGAAVTTEIGLLLAHCPAQVVGVTGSNGKSTTAAMTAAIFRAAGRTTWLGGNIGGSLLDSLDQIRPEDAVVLELSSFQLWHLGAAGDGLRVAMPHVAVVTGFTPNHLDWHGTLEHYRAAKQNLLTGQRVGDFLVLNPQDEALKPWRNVAKGQIVQPPSLASLPELRVPGMHNRINAACAAAAAACAGCTAEAIQAGLTAFPGLPQRLELCGVWGRRRFYNDSTATTPESTIAALRTIEGPFWLLAGGKPKGFSFAALAETLVGRAAGAAFFGAAAGELLVATRRARADFSCSAVETLDEALAWCLAQSAEGAAIVLSPGCASTDQFRNFQERGEYFVRRAGQLAAGPA